jgi:PQQ-dependent dehydrogenase (s-GDH family)
MPARPSLVTKEFSMRIITLALATVFMVQPLFAQDVTPRVLTSNLAAPWEITWGPDDKLWVTERTGAQILRVNPDSGDVAVAAKIDEVMVPGGQDGLLGLALHPDLLKGTPHVFAAYTYTDATRPPDPTVKNANDPYARLNTRIVRFTFDPASGRLSDQKTLLEGLPAGADHNAGRLKLGPDGMLYFTIGDMGNNQLGNWCLPVEAQRLPTAAEVAAGDYAAYVGKSLRLTQDGGIPADNPELNGVKSHVFTYGHRNPQGLAFGPDGTLYSSEQGPKTDDEANVLRSGGNYGWPHVSGFRDDMAYQFARWADAKTPCAELQFSDITIEPSVPVEDESVWSGVMQDPLATLFTVPSTHNFEDPACDGVNFVCWPTVAASSIEIYPASLPAWPAMQNSLLVTALKRGSVYRIPLSADGQKAAGKPERLWRTDNRYRDLAISPDGKRIFVITDIGGAHDTKDGGAAFEVANPGAILVFDAP